MNQGSFTSRWTSVLLTSAVLLVVGSSLSGATSAQSSNGSASNTAQLGLAQAIKADGPNPALGENAQVLGRLVGTWDVQYTDFLKSGKIKRRSGQIIFGWVLDGLAVQDLWIVDPTENGKAREVYTDLFYVNPRSKTWSSAFVDPYDGSVARFSTVQTTVDGVVFESPDFNGNITHWSYQDIRQDSFVYRVEQSDDGGKTWKLQSDYHMTRRRAVAPAE